MTEEYKLYTEPSNDIKKKYSTNENNLKVKWTVEMKKHEGMKKATAHVTDELKILRSDGVYSKWEIIEPLRLPDDVREALRDKIIATGMNEYEKYVEMADSLRVDE